MKRIVLWAVSALILHAVACAQPALAGPPAVSTKLENLGAKLAAGDAPAVAALWSVNGTYTDDSGKLYVGRDAVQKRFASGIASDGNPNIVLKNDSTKVLSPSVVVCEGTVLRKPATGEMVPETRYSIVFTKERGDWFISSATETPIAPSDAPEKLDSVNDLSWMIGDWKSEHNNSVLKLHVDWAGNKNFVRWNFQISTPGKGEVQDSTQIIGFDPKVGSLVSWDFDSTGAFGDGVWAKDGDAWRVEVMKTDSDGGVMTAHQIITPKTKDKFTWQSVDRTSGGAPLPDTDELQIERDVK
jgi:hypothetical protein